MAHENDHEINYLDPGHLIGHVKDAEYFEVPRLFAEGGKIHIPQLASGEPVFEVNTGVEKIDTLIEPLNFRLTKFMVVELVGAILVATAFISLANRISKTDRPKGRLTNMLEAMLVFMRDNVVRPAIGKHDADQYLPFIWTLFFFVLACNLLGMVPWAGAPTAALAMTGTIAFITLITVVSGGMKRLGAIGFWKAQVPHMELPLLLAIFLKPMVFMIEVGGMLIKHFVLSVRLLANMVAGHLVLATLIAFIGAAWSSMAVFGVIPASVLGATALSMLELFVAFLQAYIFAFLASLFIGMALHPH